MCPALLEIGSLLSRTFLCCLFCSDYPFLARTTPYLAYSPIKSFFVVSKSSRKSESTSGGCRWADECKVNCCILCRASLIVAILLVESPIVYTCFIRSKALTMSNKHSNA